MQIVFTTTTSPIGELMLAATDGCLVGVYMEQHSPTPKGVDDWERADGEPVLVETRTQLGEYFAGKRSSFDLPLAAVGTDFQRRVWAQLVAIPYGRTASYGEIAAAIGQPTAVRAVGLANGRNPLSIVVPCHRVVASNGKLTGYAGGLERKQHLIDLELGRQPVFQGRAPQLFSV